MEVILEDKENINTEQSGKYKSMTSLEGVSMRSIFMINMYGKEL